MSIAREAAGYHSRFGWNVIPVRGDKKPACRWKGYQSRPQDRKEVAELFRHPTEGVAVIAGEVSGGLAIRDFDDPRAYDQWAAKFRQLAVELPTVQTPRGAHVYFRSPRPIFLDLGDG